MPNDDNQAPDQAVNDLQAEMKKIDWTEEDYGEWFLITSYFSHGFTNLYIHIVNALRQLPDWKGTVQQIAEKIPETLGPHLGQSMSPVGDLTLSYEQKMKAIAAALQPWPIRPLYHQLLYSSIMHAKRGSKGRFAITRDSGEGKDVIWQLLEQPKETDTENQDKEDCY